MSAFETVQIVQHLLLLAGEFLAFAADPVRASDDPEFRALRTLSSVVDELAAAVGQIVGLLRKLVQLLTPIPAGASR